MPKFQGKILLKVFTVGVIAVAVNVAAVILDWRWDITRSRLHTLSSETKSFLSGIKQPLKLTVFYSGPAPRYLKDILTSYHEASGGKISAEIIDPLTDIGYAAQFGTMIDKNETKLFLRSGQKSTEVDFTGESLTQDLINFGILRLNRPQKTVCFTAGHGEYKLDSADPEGLQKLGKRLAEQNILTLEIVLGTNAAIPEVCDALVIPGPHNQFAREEEKKVLDYLAAGGDALILIENVIVTTPDVPLTKEQEDLNPSLDGILNPWGLRAGKDIVVDLSSHISGDPGTPATRNYMNHSSLIKDLDYTFYVRPRSLSVVPDRNPHIKLAPFVLSSSKKTSWAETNRMLQVKFDEGVDAPGPTTISYVAWGPRPDPQSSDTRLMVFTDADFLSNAFIDQFSNGQMAVNIINWLVDPDFENDLTSKDHDRKAERLDLTGRQKMWVGIALAVMPVLILCVGLTVWLRRRS